MRSSRRRVVAAVLAAVVVAGMGITARADGPSPDAGPFDAERPSLAVDLNEAEVLAGVDAAPTPAARSAQVAAAAVPEFDHTLVITDKEFYRPDALNEAQIKEFIEARGAGCTSTKDKTCLKDLVLPAASLASDREQKACAPVELAEGTRAWTAIDKVAKACNLSPKVLLTTIQKESSGVVQPKAAGQWDKMMGMGCPDGGTCNPKYAGFAPQLYFGADRLYGYQTWTTYPFIRAFLEGKPAKPLDKDVEAFVPRSMATASLYTYTPWVSANRLFHTVMRGFFPEALAGTGRQADGERWGGADRIETAIVISKQAWTAKTAKRVYVARADVTADAQVAGTLPDGPILLTHTKKANEAVRAEIARLGSPDVVVIGGTSAVSDAVARAYQAVDRLEGATREETAVAVSRFAFEGGAKSVYLTDGYGSDARLGGPDGVVGGVLTDGPVLLVKPGRGPLDAARAEIGRLAKLGPTTAYALGGNDVVHPTTPIAGADRFETALAIAKRAFPDGARSVYLANGSVFVDAIAAGTVTDGPILLARASGLGQKECEYVRALRPTRIVALGGTAAIPESTLDAAVKCTA